MDDARLAPLLESYAKERSGELMATLVEGYLPLAKAVARRFANRGVEMDDLEQVASMALMKAIERFEPERGLRFVTYAVPTITGDIRNYIRDRGGALRIPRDARAQLYRMQGVRERFNRERMREPSAPELAREMGIPLESLLSLLETRGATDVLSLDAPISEEDERDLSAYLGVADEGFARVDQKEWLLWVYRQVSDTERVLLRLRFEERLGQREVARRLGVSQMQISRLERRVLARLRAMETRSS